MQATAELQVIPVGQGVTVRNEIMQVIEVLSQYSLKTETHASGTNLEGELKIILEAVAKVHEVLHDSGSVRLLSYLKLETRIDKQPTLAGKQL
jgi:uncharacterized protein (TIGR00106 family)